MFKEIHLFIHIVLLTTEITTAYKNSCCFAVITIAAFFFQLPHLGLRFTLLSGLWLVGGAYTLISFVASMPSGWVFIMFCILLRLTEGTGSAMFVTSVLTLLPGLFPDSAGTVVVCLYKYSISQKLNVL